MIFFRLVRIVILLTLAAFFSFGALASLEPTAAGSPHFGWMAGYLVLLVAVILGLVREGIAFRRSLSKERVSS